MTNTELATARQNLAQAVARLRQAEKTMSECLSWVDITFALIRNRSL